jgi:hypothetical protein
MNLPGAKILDADCKWIEPMEFTRKMDKGIFLIRNSVFPLIAILLCLICGFLLESIFRKFKDFPSVSKNGIFSFSSFNQGQSGFSY